MLKFWKKTGSREKTEKSNSSSPAKSPKRNASPSLLNGDLSTPKNTSDGFNPNCVGPLSGFCDEALFVCGVQDGAEARSSLFTVSTRSRLSKTLSEVLADKGAIGYFIQFMDACENVSLIKFWLDVESFHSALSDWAHASCKEKMPSGFKITHEQLESTDDATSIVSVSLSTEAEIDSSDYCASPLHICRSTEPVPAAHSFVNNSDLKVFEEKISEVQKKHRDYCKSGNHHPLCTATNFKLQTDVKADNTSSDGVKMIKNGLDSEEHFVKSGCDIIPKTVTAVESEALKCEFHDLHVSGDLKILQEDLTETKEPESLTQAALVDAVRIYRKYISPRAIYPVQLPDGVKNSIASSICNDTGLLDADCFTEAQALVHHIMETSFFNDFLHSDFHCKHQIDVLTSGNVLLADILYNETALFYFMEYMEQEGNQSLVEFWIAAINFHQHLSNKNNYDPVEAQNDAIILYDKYFSLQATCPLGFNDKVRFDVEHNICREEGPLPECFNTAVNIVLYVLEKNYLQPFLNSQLYFKYLSELINTIQANPPLISRNKKSGSECSSEVSISNQNTLLAMEDPAPPRRIIRNVDDRALSIDARQLYDPDSLWRRRHQSGLSFGHINEMGRFETDMEPEPDKKESRITRVVKKLVNKDEDKAKEEMAWQIAEMIVKDITSLTLEGQEHVHS